MQPFTTHTGIAVPLPGDDINTDQIAPVQAMRSLKPDYKALLFMRARRRDDGSEDPSFVLNKPQFRNPGILVTGHNFGAGSSREAAVWGMLANNIRVIVADAQAFEQRVIAVNGAAPFVVDLNAQRVSGPGGPDVAFELPAADRMRLLEGLDDIGLTLKHADEIASWEKQTASDQPWLQAAVDRRL
jgi:3-isopropylmalate/(R)-2-methylmalate dehydratase small subunit